MKIGIAGAGIMGRLLAFAMIKAGYQVSIFDPVDDENYPCSMAAAGLLLPVTELEKSSPLIYQLGMEAVKKHWPTLLKQLGNSVYFQTRGSLVVSHPSEKSELWHFITRIKTRLNNDFHYRLIHQAELLTLEPSLSKFDSAYFFPDEGQVDNQTLLKILKDHLKQQQVKWYAESVVETGEKKIITVSTVHQFDIVFDCRGMGAKSIFPRLHGVRGELIWLYAKEVNIKRPIRFLHPRYSLYIVPRPGNIYLIGASEIEAEDYSAISVRSILELLTAAYYVHPGFAEARIIKTITQCRPAFPDHLPKIKYGKGIIAVNGLYRHGFLIAVTLMAEIIQWLESHDFSSLRFKELWEPL